MISAAFSKKIHSRTAFAQSELTSHLDFLFSTFSNDFSVKAFSFFKEQSNHQQSLGGVA